MDCLDAKQKLEPCARGELGPTDRAELDRHIATCEGCRLELELTRAVLGSSSGGAEDDPSFADSARTDDQPRSSFAPLPVAGIEQERVPESPSAGPEPPRVLTSQLPEDSEEPLDLESLHAANAYDPGAIDLPHSGPTSSIEETPPRSEENSFTDVGADSFTPASPARGGAAV
ncbi:MAG TPA: zf-HC2 domain-containing protein, partial [Candidatus Eisenbacteria bacterium]|nr:zf-HC2 domain-containing protein [Candidatus Eisenbacteria bacterium]